MNNGGAGLFRSFQNSNPTERIWSSLPIRLKGAVAIAPPLCALLFVGMANMIGARKQVEADRIAGMSLQARAKGHDLLMVLADAETGLLEYARTGDPVFLREYEVAVAGYPKLLHAIEGAKNGAAGSSNPAPAARRAFAGLERVEKYVRGQFPARDDADLSVLFSDERPLIEEFRSAMGRFEHDQSLLADASSDAQVSLTRWVSLAADLFAIAAACFGFLVFEYFLNRVVIARIACALEATRSLAAGRTIPLQHTANDEIGALMAAMQHASEHLIQREHRLVSRNADLAEALNQVREASDHKSRFLANMSHELRTPLNSIIGFTEVVHDKRAGELTESQEEFLGSSLNSARHLLALINDILDLEKIAAGHLVLCPELFDLHQLIEETVLELGVTATPKNVRLSSDLDELVRQVVLDRRKMKQILLNLVTNAVKFTQDGGRVIVRAYPAGPERFVIDIEDTGVGISEDGQTRLFQEFEQLDGAASKRQQGTGLGLVLTKKLVEAHGGAVSLVSQVGVGSTFSVLLPKAHELRAPTCRKPPPDRYDETVLVVEGDGKPVWKCDGIDGLTRGQKTDLRIAGLKVGVQ